MTGGRFRPLGYRHIAPGLAAMLLVWPGAPPGAWAAQRLPGSLVSWGDQVIPLVPPGTIFKGIAGGTDHSLALRQDGTVYAWGASGSATTVPEGLTGVIAIAAGYGFNLALKQNGTVVAWGSPNNNYGFGGTNVPSGLSNVIAIAAGDSHSLALKNDGRVAAWGYWSEPNLPSPVAVPSGLTGVVAIAAGGAQSLALKQDGTVVAWGATQDGPGTMYSSAMYPATVPDGLSNVVAIAAGGEAALALRQDGTVAMWDHQSYTPSVAQGAVAIAAGAYHGLALVNGQVLGWGTGSHSYDYDYGQAAQPMVGDNRVIAIAAGAYHSLALKQDGTIVAWGSSPSGQGTTPGLGGLVAIATEGTHTLALKQDGTTIEWGGPQHQGNPWLSGVTAIAVGQAHSLALKQEGTVAEWGDLFFKDVQGNWHVVGPPDGLSNVVAIAAGGNWSLALKQDGTVAAWGHDSNWPFTYPSYWTGVVAIAASGDHWLALKQDASVVGCYATAGAEQPPAGLTGVVGIAAGAYHSLALKQDGTVVAWGAGQTIQPGTDNQGQSIVPAGLGGVIAIAAGGDQSLALKQDATLVAWGANDSGQSTVPGGLPWVLAAAASWSHTVALVDFIPPAPVVSVAPQTQTARVGTTVGFSVQADGPPPLSYQWYFGGTNGYFGGANALGGATNAALNFTSVGLSQSGPYWVVVTNLFGAVTSPGAVLTVLAPPSLVAGPTNLVAMPGTLVNFSVEVASATPLSYQWFFNGTNLLASANNSVLELLDVQIGQSGTYEVVAANAVGSVTSAPALLTVMAPPSLVTVPTNLTVNLGTSPEFAAAAVGATPAYQWFFNGTNLLAGATNAVLDLVNVPLSQAGLYCVVVSNPFGAVTSSAAMLTVLTPAVTENTEAALRQALAGGGVVSFACNGTITLTNQIMITNDTVLDGTGHEITLACVQPPSPSGGTTRAFFVSSNVTFTAMHLTVSNGCAQAAPPDDFPGDSPMVGGAILNDGVLNLCEVLFLNNAASYGGGAIANLQGGAVHATNCTFAANDTARYGGAIFDEGGQVSLQTCMFQGNGAYAPSTDAPLDAYGGAIHSEGSLIVSGCTFSNNAARGNEGFTLWQAPGASGGPGGSAFGGAISSLGSLCLLSSAIVSNSAAGGGGGRGNSGAAGGQFGGIGSGSGGNGGDGLGGGLFNGGTASAVNCTLFANIGAAGGGGQGGAAWTGVYTDPFGHIYQVGGPAGANGAAGSAVACLCSTNAGLSLTNCTLAFNTASSGNAVGGVSATGAFMVNTLLVANSPVACASGAIVDGGHNLNSDASCAFTDPTSLSNTDPLLGPLADNGGPTLTMALLPGSPAIGAADGTSAPPTDQRGFPRPADSADIGAYQFTMSLVLKAAESPGGGIDLSLTGNPGQTFRLLAGPDLVNWTAIATNSFDPSGVFVFHDAAGAGQTQRFYRAVMP